LINTAVIPAAGLGTRLLSFTKEQPKEMVALFSSTKNQIIVQPLIERIFLQLYDAGIRNFHIIVGKKKRAIEDHFTPDLVNLKGNSNKNFKFMIEDFYKKIEKSHIVWINQNTPQGFGAAILSAKESVGNKPFLVHAGDAFVRGNSQHISKLIKTHDQYGGDVTLYVRKIINPKAYGVAETKNYKNNIYKLIKVEEKPAKPKTNFALMPIYVFNKKIFDALQDIKPGLKNELQLTDGIQKLLEWNNNGFAIKFKNSNDCIDIGTPENYFQALKISFKDSKKLTSV
jgi:UTP--glucose-1-phosphate uridylyltransferase